MKVHFSIDDVFGSLRWLARNKCKSDELYKSSTFEFINSLHKKYDAEVTLYCLCQDDGFTLRDVPDTWRDEFVRNSDWLKFGFHCNDYDSNYNSCSVEEFEYQYDEFVNQIIRIAGPDCLSDTLRLHFFSGNEDIRKYLSEKGIKILLCADDSRVSYGLSKDINNSVIENWNYIDTEMNMEYCRTLFRIEKMDDIKVIESYWEKCNKFEKAFTFFTHEVHLSNDDIKKRISTVYDLITKKSRREGDKQ